MASAAIIEAARVVAKKARRAATADVTSVEIHADVSAADDSAHVHVAVTRVDDELISQITITPEDGDQEQFRAPVDWIEPPSVSA